MKMVSIMSQVSIMSPIPEGEDVVDDDPLEIDETFTRLPARINTKAGVITFTQKARRRYMMGDKYKNSYCSTSRSGHKIP